MNRNLKLFLMFGPFVMFFAALALMVNDARHPSTLKDECIVTGTGRSAQQYKGQGREIYHHSDKVAHDISLRCQKLGVLTLNDSQLMVTPVKIGQGAWVSHKHYNLLPDRWMVSVYTGKEQ